MYLIRKYMKIRLDPTKEIGNAVTVYEEKQDYTNNAARILRNVLKKNAFSSSSLSKYN